MPNLNRTKRTNFCHSTAGYLENYDKSSINTLESDECQYYNYFVNQNGRQYDLFRYKFCNTPSPAFHTEFYEAKNSYHEEKSKNVAIKRIKKYR